MPFSHQSVSRLGERLDRQLFAVAAFPIADDPLLRRRLDVGTADRQEKSVDDDELETVKVT